MGRINCDARLGKREAEVAELLAWGMAKKEISDRLGISYRTVENTSRNIYAKVGIQKVSELCVYWFCTRCGLDPSLDPLKRAFMGLMLLCLFLPYDFHTATHPDCIRDMRPARTARAVRSTRTRGTYKNLFSSTDF